MPPTPNNVDGIKPPAPAPTGPPQRPVNQAPQPAQAPAEQPQTGQHNSVDLKAEAAEAAKQPPMQKNNASVSKRNHGPTIPIVLTMVVMIVLIGLAYFAYSKSK